MTQWKVVQMAMPQRDETIEEIKRLDALLEYAVMYGDEAEAERIREELKRIVAKLEEILPLCERQK